MSKDMSKQSRSSLLSLRTIIHPNSLTTCIQKQELSFVKLCDPISHVPHKFCSSLNIGGRWIQRSIRTFFMYHEFDSGPTLVLLLISSLNMENPNSVRDRKVFKMWNHNLKILQANLVLESPRLYDLKILATSEKRWSTSVHFSFRILNGCILVFQILKPWNTQTQGHKFLVAPSMCQGFPTPFLKV